MHVPDGFLDAKTVIATASLSCAGVGLALRHARQHLPPRRVPLMGLAAAFVFAAQMLNFPVAGGTSGHLIGATLAAVLLGPGPGVIVITSVLIVQSLLFADGGILSLGANVLNMAIVGGAGGYLVYRAVQAMFKGQRGRLLAAAFAAWCSVVMASLACAIELFLSGVGKWSLVFPAMANIHMLIGVGEAIITALVLASIARTRPELLRAPTRTSATEPSRRGYRELAVYGFLIALGLALFASPLASSLPDGLDHVAEKLGFAHRAVETPLIASPAAGYKIPGVAWSTAATSIAGAVGTIVVFALCLVLAKLLSPRVAPEPQPTQS